LSSFAAKGQSTKTADHDANGQKVRDAWTLKGVTSVITHGVDAGQYLTAKSYSDGDALCWREATPCGELAATRAVGSATNQWKYDDAGRLKSIPGHITSLTYNARGQVVQAVYANGVTTTNTYTFLAPPDAHAASGADARSWLMRVVTTKGAGVLQDITFTRGATGRINATSNTAVAGNADSWTYTYDDLDRLLYAQNAGNSALTQWWTYDAAHNMTANSLVGTYVVSAQSTAYHSALDGYRIKRRRCASPVALSSTAAAPRCRPKSLPWATR
jgi:hypothetical protein